MKVPCIPALFGVLLFLLGVLVAASTAARADDVAMSFGARMSARPVSTSLTAAAPRSTDSRREDNSPRFLLASFSNHEGKNELGESILGGSEHHTWRFHHEHEAEGEDGGGRHHRDDDGEDDDDDWRGRTPVPEPSTGLLFFSGCAAIVAWRLRVRTQRSLPTNLA